jgi:hypothetical protein
VGFVVDKVEWDKRLSQVYPVSIIESMLHTFHACIFHVTALAVTMTVKGTSHAYKRKQQYRKIHSVVANCLDRRDEVTGEWRRLHDKEIYALYSSPNTIRVIKSRRLRWAGYVARMGERRGAYMALVGKREGRRPLERPRRRWEDNIKMYLREVVWGRRLD